MKTLSRDRARRSIGVRPHRTKGGCPERSRTRGQGFRFKAATVKIGGGAGSGAGGGTAAPDGGLVPRLGLGVSGRRGGVANGVNRRRPSERSHTEEAIR
jgi:hypothetical protein